MKNWWAAIEKVMLPAVSAPDRRRLSLQLSGPSPVCYPVPVGSWTLRLPCKMRSISSMGIPLLVLMSTTSASF
ncbi:hypothetical protein BDV19DRAFT_355330 [Aspergillus venezuelensis]